MTYQHMPATLKDLTVIRDAAERIITRCPSTVDPVEFKVANLARHIVSLTRKAEEATSAPKSARTATQAGEHPAL